MFIHHIDPVFFRLGPLQIRYYGILYSISFLLILIFTSKAFKHRKLPLTSDQVNIFALGMFISGIIGARLAYVLGNDPSYYFHNPLKIFAIWEGGVGSIGAFVFTIVFGLIFCRRNRIPVPDVADICAVFVGIIAGSIRIGNFLNAEVIGPATSLPWGVKFPPDFDVARHPVSLYMALFHFIFLGILLFLFFRRNLKPGFIFWLYMSVYPLKRFGFDWLRIGPRYAGLTEAQWICIPWFFVAVFFLIRIIRSQSKTEPRP